MLGRISFEEIIHLLQEGDIFCLPSDSEGFSTSILEAASCNDYIITTRRGGASEVLLDENYGIIIDENDTQSVYDAIEKAYQYSDRKSAIDCTYQQVKNNFTWEITSNKLLSIVEEKYKEKVNK